MAAKRKRARPGEYDLLTFTEVCDRLLMTPKTVRKHMRAGRLEYLQFGREIRITPEALREFMQAHSSRAKPPGDLQRHGSGAN